VILLAILLKYLDRYQRIFFEVASVLIIGVRAFGTVALFGDGTSVLLGRSVSPLRTRMSSKHIEMMLFMRSAKILDNSYDVVNVQI